MGRYDKELASSKAMLEKARADYDDSVIKMQDAAAHVRQFVLDTYQRQIDEAEEMIQIFTRENEKG